MRSSLKKDFIILFLFLLFVTSTLLAVSIIIANSSIQAALKLDFSSAVNMLTNAIIAIANAFLAYAAIPGINTWKNQLKHKRYLDIIWDTQSNLRAYRRVLVDTWAGLLVAIHRIKKQDQPDQEHIESCLESIEVAFRHLESCGDQLDRVVIKNMSEWANHFDMLAMNFRDMMQAYEDLEYGKHTADQANAKLEVHHREAMDQIAYLETQLDEIEKRFS